MDMNFQFIGNGICIVLGFAVAWLIKPAAQKKQDMADTQQEMGDRNSSSRTRKNQSATKGTETTVGRLQGCLEKMEMAAAKSNSNEVDTILDGIAMKDIPALVQEWKKRAGFTGMYDDQKELIKRLLSKWYEKDQNAALAWVTSMESKKDKRELLSSIVSFVGEKDLDAALALVKEYGGKEHGGLDFPYEWRHKIENMNAEKLMEVLRAFPSVEGSSGSTITFKDGFDFSAMAEFLRQDKVKRGDDYELGYDFFPSNFLSSWADKDVQSAWHWAVKNPHASPFGGVGGVFEMMSNELGVAGANELAVEHVKTLSDASDKFRFAWDMLSSTPDADETSDFIARLPGQRIDNLEGLAKAASNTSGSDYDEFNRVLLKQMTEAERMQILPKIYSSSDHSESRAVIVSTLKKLGHSQAEIDVMVPAKKGK